MSNSKCAAMTLQGVPCKNKAQSGSNFCHVRHPGYNDESLVALDESPLALYESPIQIAARLELPDDEPRDINMIPQQDTGAHQQDTGAPQQDTGALQYRHEHERALIDCISALQEQKLRNIEITNDFNNLKLQNNETLKILSEIQNNQVQLTQQAHQAHQAHQALQAHQAHQAHSSQSGGTSVLRAFPTRSTTTSLTNTTTTTRRQKMPGVKCKALCMSHGGPCPYSAAIGDGFLYCRKHHDANWTPETHQVMLMMVQLNNE